MNDSPAPTLDPRPPDYPAHLERDWRAGDGTVIRLRPLRPDDAEREVAFLRGLSAETLYLRLQYNAREFSSHDIARMLDLDYADRMAVVALVGEPPDDSIVGVSRYARIAGSDSAECAIVVADAWQGRGVGTELMRSLGLAARENGIRVLVGTSLAENRRIHDWARRFGYEVRTEPFTGGEVRITLDVDSLPP